MGAAQGDLLEIATSVAVAAAELAERVRREAIRSVDTKSSETDVVTEGDLAVERLVRARLAELRPGDRVLGEEAGTSDDSAHGPGGDLGDGDLGDGGSEVCWVVDPIDGTVNYLYGYPWYAVSLAAQVAGESVAAAVVEPVSGRRWTATRGGGAYLDGRPLRVSAASRLSLSLVATGFGYQAARRARQAAGVAQLLARVRDIRRAGAASLDLCAVAAGWVDGYFEHGLHRWDWAGGALIAREAGAVVRVPDSPDGLTFAAAPGIATELDAALAETGLTAL